MEVFKRYLKVEFPSFFGFSWSNMHKYMYLGEMITFDVVFLVIKVLLDEPTLNSPQLCSFLHL